MSWDINTVAISGRLGCDPELKYLPDGKPVCTMNVAVGRGEATYWLTVVAWQKTAEFAANYLTKGSMVMVSGRLQTREWEKDGQKHKTVEVVADNLRGLDRAKEQEVKP